MSSAEPVGRASSPSTRFRRLVASGCSSHGVKPSRYMSLNSRCFDDMESERSKVGGNPVLRFHVDGYAFAVFAAGELQVGVDLVGRQVTLDHLDELLVGRRLDAADRTVYRDIADSR